MFYLTVQTQGANMLLFLVSLLALFMLGAMLTIPESSLASKLSVIHPGFVSSGTRHSLRV